MEKRLKINQRTFAKITILDCVGRIVVDSETDYLFHRVTSALEESRYVLLNLADVTAIDGGGLGMIVLLHRSATNSGREFKLCNANSKLAELFVLTELDKVLYLYENEAAAIADFFQYVA
jgi:anti-anti-sigma factor